MCVCVCERAGGNAWPGHADSDSDSPSLGQAAVVVMKLWDKTVGNHWVIHCAPAAVSYILCRPQELSESIQEQACKHVCRYTLWLDSDPP